MLNDFGDMIWEGIREDASPAMLFLRIQVTQVQ